MGLLLLYSIDVIMHMHGAFSWQQWNAPYLTDWTAAIMMQKRLSMRITVYTSLKEENIHSLVIIA